VLIVLSERFVSNNSHSSHFAVCYVGHVTFRRTMTFHKHKFNRRTNMSMACATCQWHVPTSYAHRHIVVLYNIESMSERC